MSSVGSSDSSNSSSNGNNDIVRRNREDYNTKESDLIKRHQKEVRRLNEQHYAEIERLQKDHQSQMAELQKDSHDAISERDHKYTQDIEDVRNMHRKQLQNMAEETQRREEALRQSTNGDMSAQKANSNDRVQKLSADYSKNLSAQEEQFKADLDASRDAQEHAIKEDRDELTKAHQEETRAMRADRDETLRRLQSEYKGYRDTVGQERRDNEVHHLQEKQRTSDNLMHSVARERAAREDSASYLKQGFEEGLHTMRERYDQALKKESDAHKMSEDGLKADVVSRINNQVRGLQNDNTELKDANVQNQLSLKTQKEREMRNLRDAYQKNMDNYKDQRDEAIRQANDTTHKDVAAVRSEYDGQLVENNRFYRGQMNEQNRIFRTAYDNLKGDFQARNEQTKDITNDRVKKIVENSEEDKARLINLNAENHVASQRIKADQMKALHDDLTDDKTAALGRMEDRMRKQELQHAERMNMVVGKYEKQVQSLKDQLLKERKANDENMKRMTDELARVSKMEVDQVEAKNREKVRLLAQQHSEEMRQLNKRNEEKMDQVIAESKRT